MTSNSDQHSVRLMPSWDDLEESGSNLSVEDFLTTLIEITSNGLRRTITPPYANQFGLTMPEWRIISVLSEKKELPFTELVIRSATDKGQLSRTLRILQERGLLETRAGVGKKVDCLISPAGTALYEQVMPTARKAQAAMLLRLDPLERHALYTTLHKLRSLCADSGDQDDLSENGASD